MIYYADFKKCMWINWNKLFKFIRTKKLIKEKRKNSGDFAYPIIDAKIKLRVFLNINTIIHSVPWMYTLIENNNFDLLFNQTYL